MKPGKQMYASGYCLGRIQAQDYDKYAKECVREMLQHVAVLPSRQSVRIGICGRSAAWWRGFFMGILNS